MAEKPRESKQFIPAMESTENGREVCEIKTQQQGNEDVKDKIRSRPENIVPDPLR
jgi:hypothetical protein